MKELAAKFAALADPTRLRIVALLLGEGELCVCDITGILGITQSKASRHLRYLSNAGLATDRREGLWVHYRMARAGGRRGTALRGALQALLPSSEVLALRAHAAEWRAWKAEKGPGCRTDGRARR